MLTIGQIYWVKIYPDENNFAYQGRLLQEDRNGECLFSFKEKHENCLWKHHFAATNVHEQEKLDSWPYGYWVLSKQIVSDDWDNLMTELENECKNQ